MTPLPPDPIRRNGERTGGGATHAALERVVREHAGRLAAALVPLVGDFGAAEDLVQDAVVMALRRWPAEGIPDRPDAWLFTVARNRGPRPGPPFHQLPRQARPGHPAGPARRGRHRRPVTADLHLLPPGAVPPGADRAHAAGGAG